MAKTFSENIIPNCRNPLKLSSDQETHFAVQVLQQTKFVKILQITLVKSIALGPTPLGTYKLLLFGIVTGCSMH